MKSIELKQKLIDEVIEHIKLDLSNGDCTALDELLNFLPNTNLVQFLPEENWSKYKSLTN
jgi:hypothetical protein